MTEPTKAMLDATREVDRVSRRVWLECERTGDIVVIPRATMEQLRAALEAREVAAQAAPHARRPTSREAESRVDDPCPFCGSATAPRVVGEGRFSYAVLCDYREDGCGALGPRRAQVGEAAAAWIERAVTATEQ